MFYFGGWVLALWMLVEAVATASLVVSTGQETVFWIKVAVGCLGLVIAELGQIVVLLSKRASAE